MARVRQNTNLGSIEARRKLKIQAEPHFMKIEKGLALGYRKSSQGGAWIVRRYDRITRKNHERSFAIADDHREADGKEVMTFAQAQRAILGDAKLKAETASGKHYLVRDAAKDYVDWLRDNRKSAENTNTKLKAYILGADIADKQLSALTPSDMDAWLTWALKRPRRHRAKTVPTPVPRIFKKARHPKPETAASAVPALTAQERLRRRRATLNRIITPVKAMLNHALSRRKVASDEAWSMLAKFKRVNASRLRWLTEDEATRLLNASPPDFRAFAGGGLVSGCGPGELARAEARDFDPHSRTLLVSDKTREPRRVPLTDEGVGLFESLTAGLGGHELIFKRSSGLPWTGKSWGQAMREASAAARISPAVTYYVFRHTWASHLVQRGTPLIFVAMALGHKDTRMVELHYGHLKPSHVADTIRANLPSFGVVMDTNVRPLRRSSSRET